MIPAFDKMANYKLLDGGSATELLQLGKTFIHNDPLWSARLLHCDPDAIKTMHKSFLYAGSEIVVTTSYQASVKGFMEHLCCSEDHAFGLIQNSVHLAKQACDEVAKEKGSHAVLVAGSVGPYGAVLCDGSEYTGKYIENITQQELIDFHRPRIKALVEGGVDLIAIETIPAKLEAETILELLQHEFPRTKAWVTFSCKNGLETCHGESFCESIQSVSSFNNVVAVGVNCTDPKYVTSLLKSIKPLNLQKPVIVKPNSGEPWEKEKGWYGKEHCPELCDMVLEWVENGGTWIGGCCRIFPSDIEKIRHKLRELNLVT